MENGTNGVSALDSTRHVPITELTPDIIDVSNKSIRAIVTLTWPYSSISDTVAFLLSEPDFRLRRSRGQIRVQFSGPSAKAVQESGIASGDEIVLSLDGVACTQGEAAVTTPGRGLGFELRFVERLSLRFMQEGSTEQRWLDLDHPIAPCENLPTPVVLAPELDANQLITFSHKRVRLETASNDGDEYSSPAFIKRARTSYGSMFEYEYDPFSEDNSAPGRERKNARLSSSWKYNSRSPTPESNKQIVQSPDAQEVDTIPTSAPSTADEACQTIGLDEGDAAQVLASFARQTSEALVDTHSQPTETDLLQIVQAQLENNNALSLPIQDELVNQPANSESLNKLHTNSVFTAKANSVLEANGELLRMGNHHSGVEEQAEATDGQHSISLPLIIPPGENDIYDASPPRQFSAVISRSDFPQSYDAEESPTSHLINEREPRSGSTWPQTNPRHLGPSVSVDGAVHSLQGNSSLQPLFPDQNVQHVSQSLFPHVDVDPISDSQYPELDNVTHDQKHSAWTHDRPDAPYSPLDEVLDGGEVTPRLLSSPTRQPAPSCRSQSARSEAIDLTESDDEDKHHNLNADDMSDAENDGDYEVEIMRGVTNSMPNIPHLEDESQQDVISQDVQGLYDEDEYQTRDREEEGIDEMASSDEAEKFNYSGKVARNSKDNDQNLSEQENDYRHDEDEYEHGYPRHHDPRFLKTFDGDDGNDYDEDNDNEEVSSADDQQSEQGSYEEEEMEEEDSQDDLSPMAQTPIVIDLLSSDDEDEDASTTSRDVVTDSLVVIKQQQRSNLSSDERDTEGEVGEGQDRQIGENFSFTLQSPTETKMDDRNSNLIFAGHRKDTMFDGEEGEEGGKEDDLRDEEGRNAQTGDVEERNYTRNDLVAKIGQATAHSEGQTLFRVDEDIAEIVAVGGSRAEGNAESLISDSRQRNDNRDNSGENVSDIEAASEGIEDRGNRTEDDDASMLSSNIREGHPVDHPSGQLQHLDMVSQVPNLDGADDSSDQDDQILYPALPMDDLPLAKTNATEDLLAQFLDTNQAGEDNRQLPTPDGTQMITRTETAEKTFTGNIDPALFKESEERDALDVSEVNQSRPLDGNIVSSGSTPLKATDEVARDVNLEPTPASSSITIDSLRTHALQNDQPGTLTSDQQEQDVMHVIPSYDADTVQAFRRFELAHDTTDILSQRPSKADQDQVAFVRGVPMDVDQDDPNEAVARHSARISDTVKGVSAHNPASRFTYTQLHDKLEITSNEPEYTLESPRRSHRRMKSTASTIHTDEDHRPSTPSKAQGVVTNMDMSIGKEAGSAMVVIQSDTTMHGHDASIELALASLESLSEQQQELQASPVADLRLKLSRALRTELSEFTSLKVLRYHLNQKLDVLAVATTTPREPQRAKNGPRHYQITFTITDPSIAPAGVTEIQIFRPYVEALPVIKAGDGVLLRNFQVLSIKGRGFALKSSLDEGSSWAVFRDGQDDQIRGPPVEYGEVEKKYIVSLKAWYHTLDSAAKAKINRANGNKSRSA